MKRPSAATAISLVALFFSLGGAGLAASRYIITSSSQIKPSVLKSLRGAKGAPGTPGAPGATGPAGVNGTAGANGINGTNGSNGAPGAAGLAGTASVYAVVNQSGSALTAYSKGETGLEHTTGSGIYCFMMPPGPNPNVAVASLDEDSDIGAFAFVVKGAPDCAAGDLEVDTGISFVGTSNSPGSPLGGQLQDEGFTVIVP